MSVPSPYYVENKRIKITSAIGSLVIHLLIFLLLMFVTAWQPKPEKLVELDWGGIGGGSGNDPMFAPEKTPELSKAKTETEKSKVHLPKMESASDAGLPATVKKKRIEKTATEERVLTSKTRSHKRSGAGKGSGGGIGNSMGYSIDWGGVNSRKLLSGLIPEYPDGTNKEMPVMLQFAVLPDGSVTNVIPVKRSDELLEREAIRALQSWRFDPLPPQFDQKAQVGKVTFVFKLEH